MAVAEMKRIFLLILSVTLLAAFVAGVVWKVLEADKCFEDGGVAVDPLGRNQRCEQR